MSVHPVAFPPALPRTHEQSPRVVLPSDVLSSEVLLKGRKEILIQHGDRTYRLRHTSNDKLILTK